MSTFQIKSCSEVLVSLILIHVFWADSLKSMSYSKWQSWLEPTLVSQQFAGGGFYFGFKCLD